VIFELDGSFHSRKPKADPMAKRTPGIPGPSACHEPFPPPPTTDDAHLAKARDDLAHRSAPHDVHVPNDGQHALLVVVHDQFRAVTRQTPAIRCLSEEDVGAIFWDGRSAHERSL
jgi:hypothetical protein